MRTHVALVACMLIAATAAAGCGGAGTGAVPAPSERGHAAAARAQFTITVPSAAASAARRAPKYISSATQSLGIAIGAASASPQPATYVNLTPQSAGCSSGASGVTCTVSAAAPAGSDTIAITAYSSVNGGGNALSTATMTASIMADQTNDIELTLGGVVASIAVSVQNGAGVVPGGYATALPVTVTARDASGATIIGPGAYANPISLSDSDTSGVTSLSTTSVTAPGTVVTLTYDPAVGNGALGAPATIGASAAGVSPAAITSGSFAYIGDRFWGYNTTLTLSGAQTETTTTYTYDGSSPAPTATTTAVTLSSVTRAYTLVNAQSFNGGTYTETLQTDSFTPQAPSTAPPTNETFAFYRAPVFASGGVIDETEYGRTLQRSGATSTGVAYTLNGTLAESPTLIDVVPHTAPGAWSNTWAYTWNATFAASGGGTSTESDAANADGSGDFGLMFAANGAASPQAYISDPDAAFGTTSWSARSASIAAGGAGTQTATLLTNGHGIRYTLAVPSGGTIPYTTQMTSPSPGPVVTYAPTDWYAGAGGAALPVAGYAVSTTPWSVFPPGCSPPAALGTGGIEVDTTETFFDAFYGSYVQHISDHWYVPPYGIACEVEARSVAFYVVTTGQLRQTQTMSRTLTFASLAISPSAVRRYHLAAGRPRRSG